MKWSRQSFHLGYNWEALKALGSHITKNGSQWSWISASADVASLIAVRYIYPKHIHELFAGLLCNRLLQSGSTVSGKEFGKKVRQSQGTLRTFGSHQAVATLIKTHTDHLPEQLRHIQERFAFGSYTEEEFYSHRSQFLYWLGQIDLHAEMKNKWIQKLSRYEVFSPYIGNTASFVSDLSAFEYQVYQDSFSTIKDWPMRYFLLGGDTQAFSKLIQPCGDKNLAYEDQSMPRSFQPVQMTRQLSQDPEASHIISFVADVDIKTRIYMEILYAMLQNQFLDLDISLSHTQQYSYLHFAKTLAITDIPAHMERVWHLILQLSQSIPTKDEFSRSLYRAQSNITEYCKDGESLCSYLVGQADVTFLPELMEHIETFSQLDMAQWMDFVRRVLAFDQQQIFEVVPDVYGQGAPAELRLESLQKRLGLSNGPEQSFLADQYQFQTLQTTASHDVKGEYAHVIPLGDGHQLIVNTIPQETRAHLTVYFDGGRRFEHEKNAGITQLLMMSALDGSEEKKQLKRYMESFGVQIDIENSADFFGFHFSMHPSLLSMMVPKIIALVFESELSENHVNQQKLQLLKNQSNKSKDPFFRSVELFYQSLFGIHGYGQPRLGNQSSVLRIEYDRIQQALQQSLVSPASVLWVLTSPVRHEELPLELSKAMLKAEGELDPAGQLFSFFPKKKLKVMQDLQHNPLHSVCMGLKSINIKDHRQYYLDIMQIYWSGIGGKLSDTLIEKLNLVDTVKAYHVHLLQAGAFFIQLQSAQVPDETLFEYLQTIFTSFSTIAPAKEALETSKHLAILRRKQRLHQPRELSYDIGSRYFAGMQWENPVEVEQHIQKTNSSEIMHMMSELMDYNSFAMGIC